MSRDPLIVPVPGVRFCGLSPRPLYCMASGPLSAARPLVLIVDDFTDNREMYADYLSFLGYRVVQAVNGAEAVETAFAERPDAIVMDLSLPVVDGWEATRRLKADPRTKNIPVLVLSGHVFREAKVTALGAGADFFIPKPCLPEDLAARIAEVLGTTRDIA